MSKDFRFYIKQGEKFIPFRHYIQKNGDSWSYRYLNRKDEKELLCNRWRILKYCGKKFIANEEGKDAVEVTPNDIVVSYPILSVYGLVIIMLLLFFFTVICAGMAHLFISTEFSFIKLMKISAGVEAIFCLFVAFFYIESLEIKKLAKKFNDEIIPQEKLK